MRNEGMKKNMTANKDFEKLRDLKMQLDASQTKKISKSNLKGKPADRAHFTAMNAWSSMTNTDKKQEQEEKLWESLNAPIASVHESEDVILLKGSKNVDIKPRLRAAANEIMSPRQQRNATTLEES